MVRHRIFICPQPVERSSSSWGLVGNHASDGAPQNLRRGPIMERAMLWVRVHPLAPEFCKLELVPE